MAERDATEIAGLLRRVIELLGENPSREGLQRTPERWARSLLFHTGGYVEDPRDMVTMFEDGGEQYDQMVVQSPLRVWSTCEHHVLPFFGYAHIAYIPGRRIIGLSKLWRVLDIFSRRLQVQERLTTQVAEFLERNLEPRGVAVVLQCRHSCMECRGIRQAGAVTTTSDLRGAFRETLACREEFMRLIQRNGCD